MVLQGLVAAKDLAAVQQLRERYEIVLAPAGITKDTSNEISLK